MLIYCNKRKCVYISVGAPHERIIKWTQLIGFLTLPGMERVVERNHGNDLKEGFARILSLSCLAKFDYSLYFYFYKCKQNKCGHALYCDIITIKKDCCWLYIFF